MAHSLTQQQTDYARMVAAGMHIGTKNSDFMMADYMFKRRTDGMNIINLKHTMAKIQMAARIIVAIEDPADIIAISARPFGQRAVLKFAHYTGAQCIAGRFTPGTFTNQITKQFREPRLLIVTDPRIDSQAIKEASYVNIPVIALCDSDSPLPYVDVAIPVNNKGKLSLALVYWMLAREVLRLRGEVARTEDWQESVDLFLYREPEEVEKMERDQKEGDVVEDAEATEGWQGDAAIEAAPVAEAAAAPAAVPAAAAPAGAEWNDDAEW